MVHRFRTHVNGPRRALCDFCVGARNEGARFARNGPISVDKDGDGH
jgi:hypothetical protein